VGGCPLFEWQPKHAIIEDKNELVGKDPSDEDVGDAHDHKQGTCKEEYPNVDVADVDEDLDPKAPEDADDVSADGAAGDDVSILEDGDAGIENENHEAGAVDAGNNVPMIGQDQGVPNADDNRDDEPTISKDKGAPNGEKQGVHGLGQAHGYNLRGAQDRHFLHHFDCSMDDPHSSQSYDPQVQLLQQAIWDVHEDPKNMFKYIFGHIMMQMTAIAGIKKQSTRFSRSFANLMTKRLLGLLTQANSRGMKNMLLLEPLTSSSRRSEAEY